MKINRCEESLSEETDIEEWPLLFDVPLANDIHAVSWMPIHGESQNAWVAEIRLVGPEEQGQRYRYQIELEPSDVGELLRRMAVEVVESVIAGLLKGGRPQVIGAVVG